MGLVCLYCLFFCVLMDSVPSGMSEDSCCDSDEGNCMARGWMVRVCVFLSVGRVSYIRMVVCLGGGAMPLCVAAERWCCRGLRE